MPKHINYFIYRMEETVEHLDLVIKEHPDSIVRFLNNGRTIAYPGFGRMVKPGRPIANQSLERQKIFLNKYANQGFIPIIYQDKNGNKISLGNYKLADFNKKVAPGGFQYYEYTFMKVSMD